MKVIKLVLTYYKSGVTAASVPALLQGLMTFHGDLLGMGSPGIASPTWIDVPARIA